LVVPTCTMYDPAPLDAPQLNVTVGLTPVAPLAGDVSENASGFGHCANARSDHVRLASTCMSRTATTSPGTFVLRINQPSLAPGKSKPNATGVPRGSR